MTLIPKKHSVSKPTHAQIRAQQDRILASKGFSGSKRQSAFFGFIVNAALEGQTDRLKEFTLGIEVFEKDESFDPSIDSIVRVEASRLRTKLSEYYVGAGKADSVRIDVPKGHYVPVFSLVNVPKAKSMLQQNLNMWIGFAVTTLIVVFVFSIFKFETSVKNQFVSPPSSIAVIPLRDWSRKPEEHFSNAVTHALISSLAESGTLQVTSLTSVIRFKNTETSISEIGRALSVAYILEGGVIRDGERVRITARLIQTDSDEQIWAKTIDRDYSALLSMQTDVANTIATQVFDEMLPKAGSVPVKLSL